MKRTRYGQWVALGWLAAVVVGCSGQPIQRDAAEALRNRVRPPCLPIYAASDEGYVLEVLPSAAESGLRPGDKIVKVQDVPVQTGQDRIAAFRGVFEGGPLRFELQRGGQTVALAIPCGSGEAYWQAEQRLLQAASDGAWDACIQAASDLERQSALRYFAIHMAFECRVVQVRGDPRDNTLVQLAYRRKPSRDPLSAVRSDAAGRGTQSRADDCVDTQPVWLLFTRN